MTDTKENITNVADIVGGTNSKNWKNHNFKIMYGEGILGSNFDSFESYEEYLVKNKQDIEKVIVERDKERKDYRSSNDIIDGIREQILYNDPLGIKSFPFVDTFKVMKFAMEAHKDQKRKYTNEPYFTHLSQVSGLVSTVSSDNLSISVAWLHDCMEDCGITYETLLDKFGMYVADGVKLLSDMEEGNRETRKELSRERLKDAPKWIQDIKLCDLISNTSSIAQHDPEFTKKYLEEKRLLLTVLTKADKGLWNLASEMCNEK